MPDIFVNYRSADEDTGAVLIERELSRRFGSERVFRASKSIKIGRRFPQELLTAVRRSSVLIAVIGERWADARTAEGLRALDDPEDWTRREIVEAFESGALVVPVLIGRATRLGRHDLPPALAELADCQYRRLDTRNADGDLARIGDDLAESVPRLAEAEREIARGAAAGGEVDNQVGRVDGSVVQARDYTHRQSGGIGNVGGDVGTFINNASGPVQTGDGPQHNDLRNGGVHFNGDGGNYIERGTAQQRFNGRRTDRQDRDR
ncbi:toll/interleukin-1 receptor domain-containing protein [Kitasatospora purpeofusca]|uniref:toll/interleukin-1 receptor domain-containing protein n=1 Tax=Kitasatospora purpeofusca TaxID=67352 RepID=UPI002254A1F0|nr:toll/interleukin-1 receptor domain-containing protein [Kitasatospora purpeofusca]MCX4686991.1 toll/interleukin-1 receptor domain-containing protein [Kitasatospora purpeofusca]